MNPQLLKRFPIANGDVRVKKWRLHAIMQCFFLLGRKFRAKIRNHSVVTGQHAVTSGRPFQLAIAHIRDTDSRCFACSTCVALSCPSCILLCIHDTRIYRRRIQAYADRVSWRVQLAVIRFCRNNILHRISWNTLRNQGTHQ